MTERTEYEDAVNIVFKNLQDKNLISSSKDSNYIRSGCKATRAKFEVILARYLDKNKIQFYNCKNIWRTSKR